MRNIIYIDTLVFLNTVITFILLLTVRQITSVRTSAARMAAASFLGGGSSLVILAPRLPFLLLTAEKAAIGCLIVAAAFFTRCRKRNLRCFAAFFVLTFCYGGAMFFLAQLFQRHVVYRNGVGYVNLDFWMLVACSAVLYGCIRLLQKHCFPGKERYRYQIELYYGGKSVVGRAYYDSADFMADCYTGQPVVIAGKAFLRPLLSEEEYRELEAISRLSGECSAGTAMYRLLPVKTVSGDRILPAFTCEKAVIKNAEMFRSASHVSLAVAEESFAEAGFDALINGNLLYGREN